MIKFMQAIRSGSWMTAEWIQVYSAIMLVLAASGRRRVFAAAAADGFGGMCSDPAALPSASVRV